MNTDYLKMFYQFMPKYRIHSGPTDCQVAAVVMETAQLVLRQFKNFTVVN